MITPAQIKGARAMLGLKQIELAQRAGISETGLIDIESGDADPKTSTLTAIQRALEGAGIEFTNGGRPGARMKPLEKGDRVRLRSASARHAETLGVSADEVLTVEDRAHLPGHAPWGHIRLRSSRGVSGYVEPSLFERVPSSPA
jgi:DNA-binding XRE family transcriptional regulator